MYELDKEAFGRFLAGAAEGEGPHPAPAGRKAVRLRQSCQQMGARSEPAGHGPAHPAGRSAGRDSDRAAALPPLSRRRAHRPGHGRARGQGRDPLPRFHPYVQAGVAAAPQGDRLVCRGPGRRGRRRLRQLPAGQPARRNGGSCLRSWPPFSARTSGCSCRSALRTSTTRTSWAFSGTTSCVSTSPAWPSTTQNWPRIVRALRVWSCLASGAASPGQSRVGLAVSRFPAQPAVSPAVFGQPVRPALHRRPAISAVRQAPTTLSHSLIATLSLVRLDRALVILLPFSQQKKPRRHGAGGAGALCSYFFSRRPSRKASPTRSATR